MSRIQDILSKAERDGTARRTRALGDEYAVRPTDEGLSARGFVDAPAVPRSVPDEPRARTAPIELPRPPAAPEAPRQARRCASRPRPHRPPSTEPSTPGRRARTESGRPHRARARSTPRRGRSPSSTRIWSPRCADIAGRGAVPIAADPNQAAESGRAVRAIAITSPNKGTARASPPPTWRSPWRRSSSSAVVIDW